MNLILVAAEEIDRNVVRLDCRRGRHLIDVLRASEGDVLRVGVIRGPIGTGRVTRLGDDHVELSLELGDTMPTEPPVDLVLAMPRPKVLSRVLQTAAAFGIGRIDVINAWRVDKSYLQSKRLNAERLRRDLLIGCEQGSTTWLPDIDVHPLLMRFVDSLLTARMKDNGALGLIAHPGTDQHIENVAHGHNGKIIVAVGPEGGWIQREIDTFVDRGFAGVSLGPRILRVEAAIAGLLAQLDMICRARG